MILCDGRAEKMRIDDLWFASIIPRSKMTNSLPTLSKGHTVGCVCLLILDITSKCLLDVSKPSMLFTEKSE